jgi:hypothetical protein
MMDTQMMIHVRPDAVEVSRGRKRPSFRRYRLTRSTWNRIMFLANREDAFMCVNEIRFSEEDRSAKHVHTLFIAIG